MLRLGTYSLPLRDAAPDEISVTDTFASAADTDRGVAIQPLLGFARMKAHESDSQKRTHLLARHSLVLAAETELVGGERNLVALVWAGRAKAECEPWKIAASVDGKLHLSHPVLGKWRIAEPDFPRIMV